MRIDPAKIRIALPAVQQLASNDCGPAVLLSILAYYGVTDVDREKAKRRLKTTRSGTTAENIAHFARACGLKASIKPRMTEAALDKYLAQQRPVACAVQAHGAGHWVVPVGADRNYLYMLEPMHDGVYGYRSRAEFMAKWWDTEQGVRVERLGVVIYKSQPPYRVTVARVK